MDAQTVHMVHAIVITIVFAIIVALEGCANCVHGSCDSNNNCVCNYCSIRRMHKLCTWFM